MSQPEPKLMSRPIELPQPAANVPDVPAPASARSFEAASLFIDTLEDAERLLKYAAKIGIDVEADVRSGVLEARASFDNGWNEATAANLLASLTKLAARLKPVTAESLKVSDLDVKDTGRSYWYVAIFLAAIII